MHCSKLTTCSKLITSASVALGAIFVVGAASAADLPARTYSKAPVMVAPVYTWTGFYVGLNAGYGWENTRTDYGYTSTAAPAPPGFEDVFGPGGPLNIGGGTAVASAISQGFLPTSLGNNQAGVFTAGGQVGYNAQFNQLVVGVETDLNWMNSAVKTTGFVAPPNGIITNVATSTAGLRWLGTLRGRAGFAVDRALFYVTGGLAYGDTRASTNSSNFDGTNTDLYAGSVSGVRAGYTVGGGMEYAFTDNISLKGEYLYYNLGSASYAVAAANTFATGEGIFTTARQKFDGSIARIGINYKWGGPIVARY
jgi:outer membrane immunogenic protein